MTELPWLDIFSTYLFGLKLIAIGLAIIMLLSGLDDLVIDLAYWSRRLWRALTIYRRHDRLDYQALYQPEEKPLAIMVPAWHETGVIGNMAELAARTLDYENYHIFVGTYPNDPDTQRDVDEVCARFPNVHKVVCARPGPTSKADCLNNVLDAIFQFERRAGVAFAGFILHDAEDVVCDMELRLFNYLVGRKDLIQVPVYPLERRWTNFTSLHYLDEFAELHGKDVPVREALAGQVPSAGVGTCFSRRAILALLQEGDGRAFDIQSLTEDYDIGFRLKARGMSEIFVRFPVMKDTQAGRAAFGRSRREASVVCVREYFPDTLQAAIRQKSRWIVGIVYQGSKTHRWTRNHRLNYFLWRDRKGAISNFTSFLASLILLQLLALLAYQTFWPDAYHFLSIFEGDWWLHTLLLINLGLMANRMLQRVIFVSGYYGLAQGLMAIPRLFWGNFINFMANWRALRQIIEQGDPRRVAWDKTSHDFPSVGGDNRSRRPLGGILLEMGLISPETLNEALQHQGQGLRLGSWLVHHDKLRADDLARALAAQSGVERDHLDAYRLPPQLIAQLPAALALHYAVMPLREENGLLLLASESDIDPVSLAALGRRLKRPVAYCIVPKGQVTIGLRLHYARVSGDDPRDALNRAIAEGKLTVRQSVKLWRHYESRQLLFVEILMALGHLDAAALKSILLRHLHGQQSLGGFLVASGIVSQSTLDQALRLQRELQADMGELIAGQAQTVEAE
ncbi:cyclic di-3',5'-guanylate-activated glycosyltransferase NrfB [Chromobacterium sp. IIBBL 290-4]|uniref:cyclic di-3',5'-guanylate-activated glycosyltransferase NfrB n=1 Tax=Chromobacterium sp. IIBBL 290-4 TaxID=2953890 RepID=UPI0020B758B3|nr:cyclic di-3',5'-guanylate-activated glycosyltransferase NrfB [Chromobacterium sp. IIBBL 290-4]UTH74153.1 cyclic di-3',5'-guanylate-activated glycosyltransferase NrfB [Chromobacterium sp. IIBBL 290-4]